MYNWQLVHDKETSVRFLQKHAWARSQREMRC